MSEDPHKRDIPTLTMLHAELTGKYHIRTYMIRYSTIKWHVCRGRQDGLVLKHSTRATTLRSWPWHDPQSSRETSSKSCLSYVVLVKSLQSGEIFLSPIFLNGAQQFTFRELYNSFLPVWSPAPTFLAKQQLEHKCWAGSLLLPMPYQTQKMIVTQSPKLHSVYSCVNWESL